MIILLIGFVIIQCLMVRWGAYNLLIILFSDFLAPKAPALLDPEWTKYLQLTQAYRAAQSFLLTVASLIIPNMVILPMIFADFERDSVMTAVVLNIIMLTINWNILHKHLRYRYLEFLTDTQTNHKVFAWTFIYLPLCYGAVVLFDVIMIAAMPMRF